MIIQYEVFENNEKFVEWQNQKARRIINIFPINLSAENDGKINEKECEINFNINVGVMVTYAEE